MKHALWPRRFGRPLALAIVCSAMHSGHASTIAPNYVVDESWRVQLPNHWILGPVSSVAIDAQNNVWILHRPRAKPAGDPDYPLPSPERLAPPVVKLDKNGRFLDAWGGAGDSYDWPSVEHGIFVDHRGDVWISGSGPSDGMVLKFDASGRFIRQIGRAAPLTNSLDPNLFGRATAFGESRNSDEIFVADGYRNHRIVVLDRRSGAVKRIWGAYGRSPTDRETTSNNVDSDQFDVVHCVVPVKSGLVYVCDRQNNRVQLFTIKGKFVRQYGFSTGTKGAGSTWALVMPRRDPRFGVLLDGSNSSLQVWKLSDGTVERSIGSAGDAMGQFRTVHQAAEDSDGNIFTAEVGTTRRVQRWIRTVAERR